jgi:predicted nucleic acid-binding protein
MSIYLVDTCIITDLAEPNSRWFEWSADTLGRLDDENRFVINPIIYSECSIVYESIEELEDAILGLDFDIKEMPREALFLAGRAFLRYRRKGGSKSNVLPDFFIGAHAAVEGYGLITRDQARFSSYFPTVSVLSP